MQITCMNETLCCRVLSTYDKAYRSRNCYTTTCHFFKTRGGFQYYRWKSYIHNVGCYIGNVTIKGAIMKKAGSHVQQVKPSC